MGLILEAILASLGIYFWSLGDQEVTKMSSKIYAEIGIEKSGFRGRPSTRYFPELVARSRTSLKAPGKVGR